MAEAIEVVNLEEVLGMLDRLALVHAGDEGKKIFDRIGRYIMGAIKKQTPAGMGPEGALDKYGGYSLKYMLHRQLHGLQWAKVDLTWSGGMIAAMRHDPDPEQVRVFFLDTQAKPIPTLAQRKKAQRRRRELQKADLIAAGSKKKLPKPRKLKARLADPKVTEAEKAYYLFRKWPFFALNENQQEEILQMIKDWIDERERGRK